MLGVLRNVAFIGVVISCIGVASSHAYAAAEGKRVAMFMGPTQDKYIGALSKSFETAATAAGLKVTVFSSPFDPALQAQQVDDAIGQKFDMLVVQTISQQAIIPPLTRAKNAGIPVILIVVPLAGSETDDLYLTFVGYDDTVFGDLAGSAMVNALVSSGRTTAKVAVLAGSMAEGKAPIRDKAFRAALAKHAGFEVVVTEDVHWNPALAERAAGQLLARFAGQGGLDGIYGMNDSVANAAIQSAESAGLTVGTAKGSIVIVGGNCQAPGIKNLEAGKMAATVAQLPVEEGKIAAAKAKDFFEGKKPEKMNYLPTELVTKANLSQYGQPCSY
jgi:ABC-type sugar transport system substrate-binding protein